MVVGTWWARRDFMIRKMLVSRKSWAFLSLLRRTGNPSRRRFPPTWTIAMPWCGGCKKMREALVLTHNVSPCVVTARLVAEPQELYNALKMRVIRWLSKDWSIAGWII